MMSRVKQIGWNPCAQGQDGRHNDTGEWFSLEEMKAPQGVCMLTSVWAREWQKKELLSDLDDQVWRDLSDDWKSVCRNRRKPRLVNQRCVLRAARINAANFRLKISVITELCGHTNTNVRKLHVSTMTSQHATRDPTTQQQGWRFGLVSPWRLDHTRGSRQDIHSTRVPITMGRLWMARYHHND